MMWSLFQTAIYYKAGIRVSQLFTMQLELYILLLSSIFKRLSLLARFVSPSSKPIASIKRSVHSYHVGHLKRKKIASLLSLIVSLVLGPKQIGTLWAPLW